MADEIGIARRRDYAELARRYGARAANYILRRGLQAGAIALPALLTQSQSHGRPMKRRRSSLFEQFGGTGGKSRYSLATKQYVQKCMRSIAEKKEITIVSNVGNTGIPTTAGRVDSLGLFNIIQGSADDQRTGNVINVLSATMRFYCTTPAGGPLVAFRIIVFKDEQTNGAVPTVADVLATATVVGGYNGDNVKKVGGARFTVLADKYFGINSVAVGTGSTFSNGKWFTLHLPTKWLGQVRYDTTTGAIGDIVKGDLNILTISDNGTATVQCNTQFTYQDG